MRSSPAPIEVFYSYVDEDEKLRRRLEIHLSLLRQQGIIAEWHDHKILPGRDRIQAIDSHLMTASVILLLISPDFLASDSCYSIVQRALERVATGSVHVIPILLRPVAWERAPFARLQPLPENGKPITQWKNQDEAFASVARSLRALCEDLQAPLRPGSGELDKGQTHVPPKQEAQKEIAIEPPPTSWYASPAGGSRKGRATEYAVASKSGRFSRRMFVIILIMLLLLISVILKLFYLPFPNSVITRHTTTAAPTGTHASPNPYPPYNGTLVLDDPLSQNDRYQWAVFSTLDGSSCRFAKGAYDIVLPRNSGIKCSADVLSTMPGNAVYEIQMTIVRGLKDAGGGAGIVFYYDSDKSIGYRVAFDALGGYGLDKINPDHSSTALAYGSSPYFNTGGRPNLIAAKVQNGMIAIYVNRHFITSVVDNTYSSGVIGISAGSGSSGPAEILFRNAKVWKL